jgi:hypothetical protein
MVSPVCAPTAVAAVTRPPAAAAVNMFRRDIGFMTCSLTFRAWRCSVTTDIRAAGAGRQHAKGDCPADVWIESIVHVRHRQALESQLNREVL